MPNSTGTLRRRRPAHVARCSGVRDVVAAVQTASKVNATNAAAAAASAALRVTPVGAHNSWSVLGDATGGVAVETMSLMNRVVRVERTGDTTGGVAVVQPGLTVRALIKALAARQLCVASVPVLLDQTVAGATQGGSHGSSLRHGTLADALVALTVRRFASLSLSLRARFVACGHPLVT